MKNLLFSSIGVALCLVLMCSCTRKQSKTVEEQNVSNSSQINAGTDVLVEEKPMSIGDSMPMPPKEMEKTIPAKSTAAVKSGVIEKPKVVVKKPNEYNTKGPNQSKIDSIKAAKAKGKFNK